MSPGPEVRPAGYPSVLEACAWLLAAGQIAMSWLALDLLPETMGPGAGLAAPPEARLDAQAWTWTIAALMALSTGASLSVHRLTGSSPLPVLSVTLMAGLAVLRAGVLGMSLDPTLEPGRVLLRAAAVGLLALVLAGGAEQARTRRRLRPALTGPASYDEPSPRGAYYWLMASLVLPWVVLPTRVRVIDEGLVALSPVSYLFVPRASIVEARPVGRAVALLGASVNLATSPSDAVQIRLRGRRLPLVLAATDRPRFLGALDHPPGVE